MKRFLLRCKIHNARVTEKCLVYEGSLTVDSLLMEAAGLVPYEMVKVYNVANGERFDTYVIPGEAGKGDICLNGAAARKGEIGDMVIIVSYGISTEEEARGHEPKLVFVDEKNRIK